MTTYGSGAPEGEEPWERLLRSVFGADADEAIAELRARGMDLEALNAAAGLADNPAMMDQILAQVRALLGSSDGPVNSDVAHDIARQVAVAEGDPSVDAAQRRSATDALGVAELWLDAVTDLAPSGGQRVVWSRSEWVERTLPAWNALAEPVARNVVKALAAVLSDQLPPDLDGDDVPPALSAMLGGGVGGPLDPSEMVERLGSAMFGMQVGQAAGTMSREVFGLTDIGVPLIEDAATALLPTNVAAFAAGLDAPPEEVQLYLALREAAHARLFTHVTWLRGHLLGLVDAYASGITIDTDALEEAVSSIDPTDPTAMQTALSGGIFAIPTTPEQKTTLARLETSLALVEGWVDEIATTAALPHLPHAMALREMIRRRRAAGGPAEQTFATLVGLELRPRRSREAANLWALLTRETGVAERDGVWAHPDLLPTALDLDDPAGLIGRRDQVAADQVDVDRAIEELLSWTEPEPGPGPSAVGDGTAEAAPGDPAASGGEAADGSAAGGPAADGPAAEGPAADGTPEGGTR